MTLVSGTRPFRERMVDLGGVVVAALVAVATAEAGGDSGRLVGSARIVVLVLAAVGCVALWWRRRCPVVVALLLAGMAVFTDVVGGAVLVAVYTVAANRRLSVALAVGGLHVLAAIPYSIVRPDPDMTTSSANALGTALLTIAVAWGAGVRSRRELVASLRERTSRAEAEVGMLAERSRGQERERIAREMHDVLAHRISLISLHAGALSIRPDLPAERITQAAETIRANAHDALDDLRQILGVLRAGSDTAKLRPQPEVTHLGELFAEFRAAGTDVVVENRLPDEFVPPAVSWTAYRLVQEGLTNAVKHAPGAQVRVRLDRSADGELRIAMCNPLCSGPGVGLPGSRSGLLGLTERARLAGGRVEHGARRGPDGRVAFHLEAWLPWPT